MAIEYVDYPNLAFKHLVKNGGNGKILLPYNEGVIIDDAYDRDKDALVARMWYTLQRDRTIFFRI